MNKKGIIGFIVGIVFGLVVGALIPQQYQGKTAKEWDELGTNAVNQYLSIISEKDKSFQTLQASYNRLYSAGFNYYIQEQKFSTCLGTLQTYNCNGVGNLLQTSSVVACINSYMPK